MIRRLAVAMATLALLVGCSTDAANRHRDIGSAAPPTESSPAAVTPEQARAIAKEAYIYGFPMVDNYRVQYTYFVDKQDPQYKGGWNDIHNTARVYTPEDTTIQTPNSDTPYSAVGADLRTEPLVLTVPPIAQDRYYSLQFVDGYTYNFAYVGSRTTGNGGGKYLLAGPNWKGEKPEGVDEVIRSDTDLAFVLYRTQLIGPVGHRGGEEDPGGLPGRSAVGVPQPAAPAPAPAIDFVPPLTADQQRTSPQFFEILDFVLRYAPTLHAEKDMRDRFASIGIGGDGGFDADALSPEMRTAIEGGMADAWAEFDAFKKSDIDTGKVTSAQLFGTKEDLKGNYLYRMAGAVLGIYGNTAAEAIYPSFSNDAAGAPLTGANNYTFRIPVRAAASGERVLVADHVRVACQPAGAQPDQAVPDQFADAAQPGGRPRRRLHLLHPERLAGHRQGGQLAAGPQGAFHAGTAVVLAQARRPQRDLEVSPARKGLACRR